MRRTFFRSTQWFYRIAALPLLGSIPKLRIGAGAGTKEIKIPKGLHWSEADAGGIRGEWITPPNVPDDAVILYLHGGGGVLGLYTSLRWMAGHISLICKLRVFLPDYRLAPEYPFPAGLNDCVAAYQWLLSEGLNPQRIVIAGDSAGGYLTISALLVLKDTGLPYPAAAVCISPSADPTCSGESIQTNALRDALLSPKFLRMMTSLYVGGHDLCDPTLSPLIADLHGLPPFLIQAGEEEILLDDSKRFSERALAAGVNVRLEIWPHMWHDWHTCVPNLPEANQAIEHIAEFIHRNIDLG